MKRDSPKKPGKRSRTFQNAGSRQHSDSLYGYSAMKANCDNKAGQQRLPILKQFIPFFILLLAFNVKIHAQEKFTFSAGLMLPVPLVTSNYCNLLGYEIEFLVNYKISETVKLSTGLGFQYGEHVIKEEVAWLTTVNEKLNIYKGIGYWNLDFISTEIPIIFIIPFRNSFFDSYLAGVSFGQYWNINLKRINIQNSSQVKINKTYMDLSMGVKKNLYQSEKLTINLSPNLGYLFYLSDYNDWQKKYIYSQIKFNFDF